MEIKRGDIVLMVAPRDLGRPRPGVVVQADELNAEFSTIFICPMTTDIQDDFPLRPLMDPSLENGLRLRSQVMTDKMAAIRREQIRSVIGRVDTGTAEQLDRSLLVVLGLAR
jgi:mRNA interferase MazF